MELAHISQPRTEERRHHCTTLAVGTDLDEHHPDAFREFLGVAPTGAPMPHARVPPPQDWWE